MQVTTLFLMNLKLLVQMFYRNLVLFNVELSFVSLHTKIPTVLPQLLEMWRKKFVALRGILGDNLVKKLVNSLKRRQILKAMLNILCLLKSAFCGSVSWNVLVSCTRTAIGPAYSTHIWHRVQKDRKFVAKVFVDVVCPILLYLDHRIAWTYGRYATIFL